jgi:hypothetical protein
VGLGLSLEKKLTTLARNLTPVAQLSTPELEIRMKIDPRFQYFATESKTLLVKD